MAVIAAFAGERPGSCMIAVPSLIVEVCDPTHASGVTASLPQDSAVQIESYPSRSTSAIFSMSTRP